jgi:hypothetical protein
MPKLDMSADLFGGQYSILAYSEQIFKVLKGLFCRSSCHQIFNQSSLNKAFMPKKALNIIYLARFLHFLCVSHRGTPLGREAVGVTKGSWDF